MSTAQPAMIDRNALRFNQVVIVSGIVLGFVLGDTPGNWLVLFIGLSLAIGAVSPGNGPLQRLYRHALVPTGLVKPNRVADDPAPHRFAQAVGGSFLLLSAALLFAGAVTAGWVLAWVVVALALANLVFNVCAGCIMFHAGRSMLAAQRQ